MRNASAAFVARAVRIYRGPARLRSPTLGYSTLPARTKVKVGLLNLILLEEWASAAPLHLLRQTLSLSPGRYRALGLTAVPTGTQGASAARRGPT